MMSLWDALRMNMMISYQELVRTFLSRAGCVNVFISINMINIKQCLMSLWRMLLFYFLAG